MITKLEEKGVRWYCETCVSDVATASENPTLKKLKNIIEHMIESLDKKIAEYQIKTTENAGELEKAWAEIAGTNQGELVKNVKKAIHLSSTTQAMISKDMEKKQRKQGTMCNPVWAARD